ncbi:endolytic transglycosylase MltG [Citricoccus sp. NR2]|uniref:endolytic transglycosylase MltG n=1 Tax=Citricoccus sp. NR2 TaxID=3004095 RepID=UPI0022DD91ED|nr:endolytic transglycosylase MltG [Citricoccus sp. NR2]WBL18190.1 endolytic transglycosylase MltG [Citricoccus sp. NR2]
MDEKNSPAPERILPAPVPSRDRGLGDVPPFPRDERRYPTEFEPAEATRTPAGPDADAAVDGHDGHDDYAADADHHAAETILPVTPAPGYQTVGGGTVTVSEQRLEERRRRRRRMMIVMASSLLVFVLVLVGLAYGIRSMFNLGEPDDFPGPGGEEVTFTVNPGEGAIVIGNRMVEEDIVASTQAFLNALDEVDTTQTIQPGEYALREEMPASDAAAVLLRVGAASVDYVPVNSGMRITEVFEALAEQTSYSVEEFEEAAADPTVFGLPAEANSLEGYIAVGQYRFERGLSPEEILQQTVDPTITEFERLGITDEQEQYDLVTIASILEAEARPDDYARVAGIINNRLRPDNSETNGLLQIDATVIYGLGIRNLQFTAEERQDASNEYNTYVHPGLPPGPIGAPSIAAIDAAAEPEDNSYYYWITTNIETGETKFSETLAEHQQYQQEFRQYCADNPDYC